MKEIDIHHFFIPLKTNTFKTFGSVNTIHPDYGDGFQWVYQSNIGFDLSIHHIEFKDETLLEYVLQNRYVLVLYISGSGNEFYPYQSISPNTLRFYEPKENYKVIYHPKAILKTLDIEFSAEFIEEFLEKKYPDINIDFSLFFANKSRLFLPKLSKLMLEIYNYNEPYPMAKLFIEGKIYEILSFISMYMLRENNHFQAPKICADDVVALQEMTKYIDEHYNYNISLYALSKIANMSVSKLKRLFKIYHTMSVTEYIQRKRVSVAEHLLLSTNLPISEIAKIVGYANSSRLAELFKRFYGFKPSNLRK